MPLLANAKKALRVSKTKATINRRVKSIVKTKVDAALDAPTTETVSAAFSAIDHAVKGKLFHRNKAARFKSRLSKLISSK